MSFAPPQFPSQTLTSKTNDPRHSQLHHHIAFSQRIQRILRVYRRIRVALLEVLRLTLA